MVLAIITEGDTSLNETCFIRRWDEMVVAEVAGNWSKTCAMSGPLLAGGIGFGSLRGGGEYGPIVGSPEE